MRGKLAILLASFIFVSTLPFPAFLPVNSNSEKMQKLVKVNLALAQPTGGNNKQPINTFGCCVWKVKDTATGQEQYYGFETYASFCYLPNVTGERDLNGIFSILKTTGAVTNLQIFEGMLNQNQNIGGLVEKLTNLLNGACESLATLNKYLFGIKALVANAALAPLKAMKILIFTADQIVQNQMKNIEKTNLATGYGQLNLNELKIAACNPNGKDLLSTLIESLKCISQVQQFVTKLLLESSEAYVKVLKSYSDLVLAQQNISGLAQVIYYKYTQNFDTSNVGCTMGKQLSVLAAGEGVKFTATFSNNNLTITDSKGREVLVLSNVTPTKQFAVIIAKSDLYNLSQDLKIYMGTIYIQGSSWQQENNTTVVLDLPLSVVIGQTTYPYVTLKFYFTDNNLVNVEVNNKLYPPTGAANNNQVTFEIPSAIIALPCQYANLTLSFTPTIPKTPQQTITLKATLVNENNYYILYFCSKDETTCNETNRLFAISFDNQGVINNILPEEINSSTSPNVGNFLSSISAKLPTTNAYITFNLTNNVLTVNYNLPPFFINVPLFSFKLASQQTTNGIAVTIQSTTTYTLYPGDTKTITLLSSNSLETAVKVEGKTDQGSFRAVSFGVSIYNNGKEFNVTLLPEDSASVALNNVIFNFQYPKEYAAERVLFDAISYVLNNDGESLLSGYYDIPNNTVSVTLEEDAKNKELVIAANTLTNTTQLQVAISTPFKESSFAKLYSELESSINKVNSPILRDFLNNVYSDLSQYYQDFRSIPISDTFSTCPPPNQLEAQVARIVMQAQLAKLREDKGYNSLLNNTSVAAYFITGSNAESACSTYLTTTASLLSGYFGNVEDLQRMYNESLQKCKTSLENSAYNFIEINQRYYLSKLLALRFSVVDPYYAILLFDNCILKMLWMARAKCYTRKGTVSVSVNIANITNITVSIPGAKSIGQCNAALKSFAQYLYVSLTKLHSAEAERNLVSWAQPLYSLCLLAKKNGLYIFGINENTNCTEWALTHPSLASTDWSSVLGRMLFPRIADYIDEETFNKIVKYCSTYLELANPTSYNIEKLYTHEYETAAILAYTSPYQIANTLADEYSQYVKNQMDIAMSALTGEISKVVGAYLGFFVGNALQGLQTAISGVGQLINNLGGMFLQFTTSLGVNFNVQQVFAAGSQQLSGNLSKLILLIPASVEEQILNRLLGGSAKVSTGIGCVDNVTNVAIREYELLQQINSALTQLIELNKTLTIPSNNQQNQQQGTEQKTKTVSILQVTYLTENDKQLLQNLASLAENVSKEAQKDSKDLNSAISDLLNKVAEYYKNVMDKLNLLYSKLADVINYQFRRETYLTLYATHYVLLQLSTIIDNYLFIFNQKIDSIVTAYENELANCKESAQKIVSGFSQVVKTIDSFLTGITNFLGAFTNVASESTRAGIFSSKKIIEDIKFYANSCNDVEKALKVKLQTIESISGSPQWNFLKYGLKGDNVEKTGLPNAIKQSTIDSIKSAFGVLSINPQELINKLKQQFKKTYQIVEVPFLEKSKTGTNEITVGPNSLAVSSVSVDNYFLNILEKTNLQDVRVLISYGTLFLQLPSDILNKLTTVFGKKEIPPMMCSEAKQESSCTQAAQFLTVTLVGGSKNFFENELVNSFKVAGVSLGAILGTNAGTGIASFLGATGLLRTAAGAIGFIGGSALGITTGALSGGVAAAVINDLAYGFVLQEYQRKLQTNLVKVLGDLAKAQYEFTYSTGGSGLTLSFGSTSISISKKNQYYNKILSILNQLKSIAKKYNAVNGNNIKLDPVLAKWLYVTALFCSDDYQDYTKPKIIYNALVAKDSLKLGAANVIFSGRMEIYWRDNLCDQLINAWGSLLNKLASGKSLSEAVKEVALAVSLGPRAGTVKIGRTSYYYIAFDLISKNGKLIVPFSLTTSTILQSLANQFSCLTITGNYVNASGCGGFVTSILKKLAKKGLLAQTGNEWKIVKEDIKLEDLKWGTGSVELLLPQSDPNIQYIRVVYLGNNSGLINATEIIAPNTDWEAIKDILGAEGKYKTYQDYLSSFDGNVEIYSATDFETVYNAWKSVKGVFSQKLLGPTEILNNIELNVLNSSWSTYAKVNYGGEVKKISIDAIIQATMAKDSGIFDYWRINSFPVDAVYSNETLGVYVLQNTSNDHYYLSLYIPTIQTIVGKKVDKKVDAVVNGKSYTAVYAKLPSAAEDKNGLFPDYLHSDKNKQLYAAAVLDSNNLVGASVSMSIDNLLFVPDTRDFGKSLATVYAINTKSNSFNKEEWKEFKINDYYVFVRPISPVVLAYKDGARIADENAFGETKVGNEFKIVVNGEEQKISGIRLNVADLLSFIAQLSKESTFKWNRFSLQEGKLVLSYSVGDYYKGYNINLEIDSNGVVLNAEPYYNPKPGEQQVSPCEALKGYKVTIAKLGDIAIVLDGCRVEKEELPTVSFDVIKLYVSIDMGQWGGQGIEYKLYYIIGIPYFVVTLQGNETLIAPNWTEENVTKLIRKVLDLTKCGRLYPLADGKLVVAKKANNIDCGGIRILQNLGLVDSSPLQKGCPTGWICYEIREGSNVSLPSFNRNYNLIKIISPKEIYIYYTFDIDGKLTDSVASIEDVLEDADHYPLSGITSFDNDKTTFTSEDVKLWSKVFEVIHYSKNFKDLETNVLVPFEELKKLVTSLWADKNLVGELYETINYNDYVIYANAFWTAWLLCGKLSSPLCSALSHNITVQDFPTYLNKNQQVNVLLIYTKDKQGNELVFAKIRDKNDVEHILFGKPAAECNSCSSPFDKAFYFKEAKTKEGAVIARDIIYVINSNKKLVTALYNTKLPTIGEALFYYSNAIYKVTVNEKSLNIQESLSGAYAFANGNNNYLLLHFDTNKLVYAIYNTKADIFDLNRYKAQYISNLNTVSFVGINYEISDKNNFKDAFEKLISYYKQQNATLEISGNITNITLPNFATISFNVSANQDVNKLIFYPECSDVSVIETGTSNRDFAWACKPSAFLSWPFLAYRGIVAHTSSPEIYFLTFGYLIYSGSSLDTKYSSFNPAIYHLDTGQSWAVTNITANTDGTGTITVYNKTGSSLQSITTWLVAANKENNADQYFSIFEQGSIAYAYFVDLNKNILDTSKLALTKIDSWKLNEQDSSLRVVKKEISQFLVRCKANSGRVLITSASISKDKVNIIISCQVKETNEQGEAYWKNVENYTFELAFDGSKTTLSLKKTKAKDVVGFSELSSITVGSVDTNDDGNADYYVVRIEGLANWDGKQYSIKFPVWKDDWDAAYTLIVKTLKATGCNESDYYLTGNKEKETLYLNFYRLNSCNVTKNILKSFGVLPSSSTSCLGTGFKECYKISVSAFSSAAFTHEKVIAYDPTNPNRIRLYAYYIFDSKGNFKEPKNVWRDIEKVLFKNRVLRPTDYKYKLLTLFDGNYNDLSEMDVNRLLTLYNALNNTLVNFYFIVQSSDIDTILNDLVVTPLKSPQDSISALVEDGNIAIIVLPRALCRLVTLDSKLTGNKGYWQEKIFKSSNRLELCEIRLPYSSPYSSPSYLVFPWPDNGALRYYVAKASVATVASFQTFYFDFPSKSLNVWYLVNASNGKWLLAAYTPSDTKSVYLAVQDGRQIRVYKAILGGGLVVTDETKDVYVVSDANKMAFLITDGTMLALENNYKSLLDFSRYKILMLGDINFGNIITVGTVDWSNVLGALFQGANLQLNDLSASVVKGTCVLTVDFSKKEAKFDTKSGKWATCLQRDVNTVVAVFSSNGKSTAIVNTNAQFVDDKVVFLKNNSNKFVGYIIPTDWQLSLVRPFFSLGSQPTAIVDTGTFGVQTVCDDKECETALSKFSVQSDDLIFEIFSTLNDLSNYYVVFINKEASPFDKNKGFVIKLPVNNVNNVLSNLNCLPLTEQIKEYHFDDTNKIFTLVIECEDANTFKMKTINLEITPRKLSIAGAGGS